jgi:hypothetical protein
LGAKVQSQKENSPQRQLLRQAGPMVHDSTLPYYNVQLQHSKGDCDLRAAVHCW